ncbi:haloacid dehalogenase-like hydrolase, putative [Plasmodium vinckei brucechwatti]|uniref:Haloacid dehalogenase-like hydrolase, putative n=1 Tax=Plasmodium vinckei brucechwatti TaxID=119398 RepID=A0A6V7RUR9_PLAVN|nr:haloacid dehalogenase-like hydrolase, putative [Plasmodium vinckei brucechwatti]
MNPKLIQISLFLLLICLCKGYSGKKNDNNGNKIIKLNRLLSEFEKNEVEVYENQQVYEDQPVYKDQPVYEEQPNYEMLVRDKNGKPFDKNNLKNNIKIVFTDLDRTLLNDNHKISRLNIESLVKAQNKGIKIVFATGRPIFSANGVIGEDVKQNNLSLIPGIYLNGCITYGPNGDKIIDNCMDEKLIMDIYNFSKGNNLVHRITLYSLEKIHTFEINEYIDEETLKNTKIYNIAIRFDEQNLSSVLKLYQDKFSGRISVAKKHKACIELFHRNTNKFEGVKALCKHFDINLNDALAIGDGENDIEMFQGVGTSIAVQNAASKIKKCAKYVGPSNNDNAVHHILRTFCDI